MCGVILINNYLFKDSVFFKKYLDCYKIGMVNVKGGILVYFGWVWVGCCNIRFLNIEWVWLL